MGFWNNIEDFYNKNRNTIGWWTLIVSLLGIGIYQIKIKNSLKGRKIAILGLKGVGKTRLLRFLQQKKYEEVQTTEERYPEFSYTKRDGTEILIHAGIDVGGGEDLMQVNYEKLIEENDSIIQIINIEDYLNNVNGNYRELSNALMDFINRKKGEKDIVTIFSHIDKCKGTANHVMDQFWTILRGKYYFQMIERNWAAVNLTDSKQLRKIEDKIFKP